MIFLCAKPFSSVFNLAIIPDISLEGGNMGSTIYPTGTTVYNPEKCWNGYTLFQSSMNSGSKASAVLIDMNGRAVNIWKGLDGFPNKMLPGGYVLGCTGGRDGKYAYQDMLDLVQVDWEGNIVWEFKEYERIKDPNQKEVWMARQHHDYQREGNPVGYYVPGMNPQVDKGNTFLLCHKNMHNPDISDKVLIDDSIIEINWQGIVIWEWVCSDHFNEMNFSQEARNTLYRLPHPVKNELGEKGDWMHMNSMSLLGPNRFYDAGDERFHPDNIIWDGRSTNIIAIISKKTGKIVWQVGPDYFASEALRKLGQMIGQHHAHMIPKGLPGEGNILVFDNGGWAGYGNPNPGSPNGLNNAVRDYSRIIEFDPVTLEVVWKYTAAEAGFAVPTYASNFYSTLVSSAQRLPNGNTLIDEGVNGRIFEVTRDHELVWEFISPYEAYVKAPANAESAGRKQAKRLLYRAYRVPYDWVPQVEKPVEIALKPIDNSKFRVPGSPKLAHGKKTRVKTKRTVTAKEAQYCVIPLKPPEQ
jgi:hypothetical protein